MRYRYLVIIVIVTAALLIAADVLLITQYGKKTGPTSVPKDQQLSFEKFTLDQLLHFQLTVDFKTSGTPIKTAELDLITQRVEKIRGLPQKEPIVFLSMTPAALKQQLAQEFRKESTPAETAADQKLLAGLGLIPQNENLADLLINVYTEQIAGAYDPDQKVITVIEGKTSSSNNVMDEITMSHEITHALQDQNFNLTAPPLEVKSYNGDNNLAVESLIEGDATNVMVEYTKEFVSTAQLLEQQSKMGEISSAQLDQAPLYIRNSLLYPYEQGLTFAKALQDAGGGTETATNQAFLSPPLSTEQIYHANLFLQTPRDDPVTVEVPDLTGTLGTGWKRINSDCMGAFDVNSWFQQYGGLLLSRAVSNGWGGNTVQYYQGPKKSYVLVNDFVWDTDTDAKEFFDGYQTLLSKRFGGTGHMGTKRPDAYVFEAEEQFFYCGIAGKGTLAIQATDRATLNKAVQQFNGFPAMPLPGV